MYDYIVTNIKDITDRIIPFFIKYRTRGIKSLNFTDWHEGAKIIKSKEHLSEEGVERIRIIQGRMNSKRSDFQLKNNIVKI